MAELINGVADNGWKGKHGCEQSMMEIMALSTAIMAMGMAEDEGGPTGNIEAVVALAGMIRERLLFIDRKLFPDGPVFDENDVGGKGAANG